MRRYFLSQLPYGEEEERAVQRVIQSRWLTMGPRTAKFEKRISGILDGVFCSLVSSGTTALHLALMVLGTGRGDEVILPSLTFVAPANVTVQCGAKCVFADIEDIQSPLLSVKEVQRKISPRTRVILPVHYAGFGVDMDGLSRLARKERARRKKAGESRPLYIVEDAAHAVGSRDLSGRALGTIGDLGCFSLFSNKNIATGEGGIVATSNKSFAGRVVNLRSHGLNRQTWERHRKGRPEESFLYDMEQPGYNYRPTEITAELGLCQLKKLKKINRKKGELYRFALGLVEGIPGILPVFPEPDRWGLSSCHILPVLVKDNETRKRAVRELARAGIQTSHHYRPIHTMTYYRKKDPGAGRDLGVTGEYAMREITLPLHTGLSRRDMEHIVRILKKAVT